MLVSLNIPRWTLLDPHWATDCLLEEINPQAFLDREGRIGFAALTPVTHLSITTVPQNIKAIILQDKTKKKFSSRYCWKIISWNICKLCIQTLPVETAFRPVSTSEDTNLWRDWFQIFNGNSVEDERGPYLPSKTRAGDNLGWNDIRHICGIHNSTNTTILKILQ